MSNRLALLWATWFGCGYFPWGPGTIGTLGGLVAAYFLAGAFGWGPRAFPLLALACLPISVWAAGRAAEVKNLEDPQIVVIDEVLGVWVTLLGAAQFSWPVWLLAFGLFRVFDITKPYPLRELEDLPGGWGIVADDLGAGLYSAVVLFACGLLHWI